MKRHEEPDVTWRDINYDVLCSIRNEEKTLKIAFENFHVPDRQTDGQTDKQMDRQTHSLIEMRESI